jgi:hypothetical protein
LREFLSTMTRPLPMLLSFTTATKHPIPPLSCNPAQLKLDENQHLRNGHRFGGNMKRTDCSNYRASWGVGNVRQNVRLEKRSINVRLEKRSINVRLVKRSSKCSTS